MTFNDIVHYLRQYIVFQRNSMTFRQCTRVFQQYLAIVRRFHSNLQCLMLFDDVGQYVGRGAGQASSSCFCSMTNGHSHQGLGSRTLDAGSQVLYSETWCMILITPQDLKANTVRFLGHAPISTLFTFRCSIAVVIDVALPCIVSCSAYMIKMCLEHLFPRVTTLCSVVR